jgi:hypothetical protein
MKIEIVKVDSGKFCMHESCQKLSKYVTPKGRIRKGTTAARFTHKAKSSSRYIKEFHFYYCRGCIDQLLLDCRARLDSKLWIFS